MFETAVVILLFGNYALLFLLVCLAGSCAADLNVLRNKCYKQTKKGGQE